MYPLEELFEDRYSEKNQSDIIRFYSMVDTSGSCWEWRGARTKKGYGSFSYNYKGKSLTLTAHRVCYVLIKGFFNEGLQLLHSCDNPSCVNPSHLTPGTNMENILDKMAKNRQSRKRSHFGESTPRSVLTEPDVINILKLVLVQGMAQRTVAKTYGVQQSAISHIVRGKNWKHVPRPILGSVTVSTTP